MLVNLKSKDFTVMSAFGLSKESESGRKGGC